MITPRTSLSSWIAAATGVYAYNPGGAWTSRHQMTLNGRRDGFLTDDLLAAATHADLRTPKAKSVIREVRTAVGDWKHFAEQAGVFPEQIPQIKGTLRLDLGA
jgi:serine/threonine-protein kinase HipA